MGRGYLVSKRKKFQSLSDKDLYPTIDPRAVDIFKTNAIAGTYAEPCYGYGDLERLLVDQGINTCKWRSDIDPEEGMEGVVKKRAEDITEEDLKGCDTIVTNPPYTWDFLKPILDHLPNLRPTLLLLPADMMHNKRMAPYMRNCSEVLSVGRLYWMKDSPIRGVDNFAWYAFENEQQDTIFTPRWNV